MTNSNQIASKIAATAARLIYGAVRALKDERADSDEQAKKSIALAGRLISVADEIIGTDIPTDDEGESASA